MANEKQGGIPRVDLPADARLDTLAVREGLPPSPWGENSEALYLTSGFVQPDAETSARRFADPTEGYTYGRTSNPTVTSFERRLAALEGTEAAIGASTGMGAILMMCMGLLKAGDHVICSRSMFGSTIAGPAKELQTSPRGIFWPPLPPDDKAGWERVRKIGPYFTEYNATCGAGEFSKDKPVQMGTYPYPIYTVYASQPEADVYMLTKALIEGYDGYKDNAPGASGLAVKTQTKNWAVPVHPGAVKALKSCFEARVKKTAPGSASTSAFSPMRVHICAIAWATAASLG